MSIERHTTVRTRRGLLFAALLGWGILGIAPLLVLAALASVRLGPWLALLGAALVLYSLVLFALGHAWSWRWKSVERRVRADERGLWIDDRLAWKRRAIRRARIDDEGRLQIDGLFRATKIDVAEDGAAWLAAMRLDPERSVARFFLNHGTYRAAILTSFVPLVVFAGAVWMLAVGAHAAGALVLFVTLIAAVVWAIRTTAGIEVGADGVRIARTLGRPRYLPFSTIERIEQVNSDVHFVLRSGEVVVVHQASPAKPKLAMGMALDERAAFVERVNAQLERHRDVVASGEAFARGDRTTEAWLDDLARVGEPATFRTPAVPVEVLWRVVEDATAATTARAGAAFALRSSLDDEGKARLRIVADACAAPKLRVALDEIATGEEDVADTFDALVDGDVRRRAVSS